MNGRRKGPSYLECYLRYEKMSVRSITRLLITDQKMQPLIVSKQSLVLHEYKSTDFLRRVLDLSLYACGKTQSKQWTGNKEPIPKKIKNISSVGKDMATDFGTSKAFY